MLNLNKTHPRIKYIIPITLSIFFTYQVNVNIDKKVNNELIKLQNVTGISHYEFVETKRDKILERAISKLKNNDIKLDKKIKINDINKRLSILKDKLKIDEPKYNKHNENYQLLKSEYNYFKRTFAYMTRVFKMFKEKGKSKQWVIDNQLKYSLTSAKEVAILNVYNKYNILTYHDVEVLSTYPFSRKPTHPLSILGISFMDRVKREMNNQKNHMNIYKIKVKTIKEKILAYEQIKKEK